jgi:hypothetical protein
MKLRADQLRALEAVAWAEFELRMVRHWREVMGRRVQGIDDETLRRLAREAISDARKKGLSSELHIATYADLCVSLGTGFAAALPRPRRQAGGP